MATNQDKNQDVDLLRALRDEIRLQVHLAGMEVKDRWRALEPELEKVERQLDRADAGARELARDLTKRFKAFRDSLEQPTAKRPSDSGKSAKA
jgi:hypothetical protein